MENYTLVIDESGAKGYASTTERSLGEIGVMAGFVYSESDIQFIKMVFESYTSGFVNPIDGKFHITDFPIEKQSEFRNLVFSIAKELKLQWFFSAVYAQGFHESEFGDGRGYKNKNNLLHTTLFKNMLIKSLSMTYSIGIKNVNLNVITDTIDSGVMKKFEATANEIKHLFLGEEKSIVVKQWNPDSKIVKKTIIHSSISSEDMPKYNKLNVEINCEESVLTIIADVLVNSVRYYLRQNRSENLENDLNSELAIKGHPLLELVLAPKDSEEFLPFQDILYRREAT
ncbi:hypothetical protein GLP14_06010 [Photobacterium carnosum]|uniref:hypothetical protein n=1 Tax=Photobacterium carnosum TaxID=2023717 RepID=UPI001E4D33E0|nr:hypothetical protein [Photobacterium carnosum]MCD9522393.1 hypothetical protein [Photobacterium carnosum]